MSQTSEPSLTDALGRPMRDLRVSVTDRCNFRCPYCMPAEIFDAFELASREHLLTFEEITRLVGIFVGLGVTKVRITGGEPLLRSQLPVLVARLAVLEDLRDLALTTNGYLLAEKASALRRAGLGRVTVSVDSLDPGVFRRLSGRDIGPEKVLEGIEAARREGLTPIKLNCVVQRGVNDHTMWDLASRYRGTGIIVRFIEFMDVGNINRWSPDQVVPAPEILARIQEHAALEPVPPRYPGEVARRYHYTDGSGEVGIVASVSEPFCGGCTRARLTTDGKLVTCLFATEGTDLLHPLRAGAGDQELAEMVRATWGARKDRYSEERAAGTVSAPLAGRKIEMYRIGG